MSTVEEAIKEKKKRKIVKYSCLTSFKRPNFLMIAAKVVV